jgi:glucose/arabinose dehydrogenase
MRLLHSRLAAQLLLTTTAVLSAMTAASCGGDAKTAGPSPEGYGLAPVIDTSFLAGRTVGFAVLPDNEDEAIVFTQQGALWRVSLNETAGSPARFGDISDRLDPAVSRTEVLLEIGLLGLAFSPDFDSDGFIYLHYTSGEPIRSILSRFLVSDGVLDPSSETILLDVSQPSRKHNGGQLAFGPDGYLYIALGEGAPGANNSQDLSSLLGGILRLDVSGPQYTIPPDNPFVREVRARPEIYAYGLRNPWRFSFDTVTGEMWAGDVGESSWEEVDRIVPGGNYGWNITEGRECLDSEECDLTGLEAPRAVYSHDDGCAITGGYVYRGSAMPELVGWYVYGDFCSGRIWAVNSADDSPPVLLADSREVITTFGQRDDGELLVVAAAGGIYGLERID